MVNSAGVETPKEIYAKALNRLLAFAAEQPLTRALQMEREAGVETQAVPQVNRQFSPMRRLVGRVMAAEEEGANLPLRNLPNNPEQKLFAEGMAEALNAAWGADQSPQGKSTPLRHAIQRAFQLSAAHFVALHQSST